MTSERESFELLLQDADAPFSGWDFSYISKTKRSASAPWEWSYASTILPLVRSVAALLDMGTGGGEFLASLRPLPERTVATEGYQPNIPLARARLEPLGVRVCPIGDDDQLPLADAAFELVINRHESYDPAEVLRVLTPGGTFVTQQIEGFSVEGYRDQLWELHRKIQRAGYVDVRNHRFLLVARKPS